MSDGFPKFLDEDVDLSAVFALVPSGIFIADAENNCIVYNNAAFGRLLHAGKAGLLGRRWHDLVFDDAERADVTLAVDRRGRIEDREIGVCRSDGTFISVTLSVTRIRWGQREVLFGSLSDLTPLKDAEKQVRLLADQDALTGLPNPRCIRDRLERALSRARRHDDGVAVMFIDLDQFKSVNDTFGHAAGDAVLKTVAQRLNGVMRDCDTVGRQGGDEFVVMLTDIADPEVLSLIAKRAVDAIAAPIAVDGISVEIGASIGIASFPEHGDDVDVLLRRADEAMYAVKRAGKNDFRVAA